MELGKIIGTSHSDFISGIITTESASFHLTKIIPFDLTNETHGCRTERIFYRKIPFPLGGRFIFLHR